MLFNLKFASKEMLRESKKCEKAEKEEKNKLKKVKSDLSFTFDMICVIFYLHAKQESFVAWRNKQNFLKHPGSYCIENTTQSPVQK